MSSRDVVARQAAEIERLRQALREQELLRTVHARLAEADAALALAAAAEEPRLQRLVLETAAQVIGARAGALFLLDRQTRELYFEAAVGAKAAEVRRFRVPVGHGIAGLVALSGQPMAVAGADADPRQAADIAQAVGYQPRSILCVPLLLDDRQIGVLELLDKVGAEGFGLADMETLRLFAAVAAIAIEQAHQQRELTDLVRRALRGAGGLSVAPDLEPEVVAFAAGAGRQPEHRRVRRLASLVQAIGARGEREATACAALLESFDAYLEAAP
jgi:GAF domain-containing protein